MVVQAIRQTGKTKVGVLVANTPNYDETFRALTGAARQAGLQIVRTARIGKNAGQSEALAETNEMRVADAEAALGSASRVRPADYRPPTANTTGRTATTSDCSSGPSTRRSTSS